MTRKEPAGQHGLQWIRAGILTGYLAMMALILLDVVLLFDVLPFASKKAMPMPQWALLLLGVAGILGAAAFFSRHGEQSGISDEKDMKACAAGLFGWMLLFVVQVCVCYFSYFLTDWDSEVVTRNAYWIATGVPYIDHNYYAQCSNNALLTLLYAAVMRVFYFVAPTGGLDRYIFVVIVFQCAVNTLTGILTWRLALRWTRSRGFARLVCAVYVCFIGLSPWIMIPYSDPIAIAFPVVLLNLVDLAHSSSRKGLAWLGIAALSALSMLIKPQAAIMAIALAILEAARLLSEGRFRSGAARAALVLLAILFGAGPGLDLTFRFSPLERNRETELDMLHYFMMGLNAPMNGSYFSDDVDLSVHTETKAERHAVEFAVIKERVQAMDAKGWASFLAKKTLTNYADGTFAWGINGRFFAEQIADKDDVLSPFLKDLFNSENGRRYPVFQAFEQAVWLALLLFSLASVFAQRAMSSPQERFLLLTMLLGVIGLTLFETIFEARARYLLTFAPIYLLVGLRGAWHVCGTLKNLIRAHH